MPAQSNPAYATLAGHARRLQATTLQQLFARDASRTDALGFEWDGWRIDIAKERIDAPTLSALLEAAEGANLPHWIGALFAGEKLNLSEHRPVLHPALRAPRSERVIVDGVDIVADAHATRERMAAIVRDVRQGLRTGATGQPLRSVINIGIGGSDLGPRLACDALDGTDGTRGAPDTAFVSNVDPEHLTRALAARDAASTLFIVTSKTFTTQETLANAHSAREWLARQTGERDVSPHFIAVTSNVDAARGFGVRDVDILPMAEGVGGRYSLWSAVGLAIAIRAGWQAYVDMLAGAQRMDAHFRTAPLARNVPVVLGLLAFWNTRWLGHSQRIIVPYAQALARLPAYLQQLQLESNGKSVLRDGAPVAGHTACAVWGDVGTDSQHAFFQWLHQGTRENPVEFVVPVRARHPLRDQQTLLVANALAQAQALLVGRADDSIRRQLGAQGLSGPTLDAAVSARRCPGNRASTTLLLPTLDAGALGALLALYEHRTFVEGVLYGINSFDQWGVELGKSLAGPIVDAIAGHAPLADDVDPSTRALVARVRALQSD
jgi:glucose-6-phosphate isomerase